MVKTTVKIEGMMCGMCEAHVNDAIREHFQTKKVEASRTKKQAEILSDEALDAEALKQVINDTGYEALSVETEPYEKKGFHLFGKK